MPTPKTGYYTSAGVRVPGVTTVLGRFKESGALIYWSWNLAYVPYRQARAQIEKIVAQGAIDPGTLADCKDLLQVPIERADFRHVRDNAASIGTIVHARIEAWTHGVAFNQTPYPEADVLSSDIGFSAFLEWAGSTKFSLAETEMQLVSEKHKYGGTPDVIMIREQRTTGDYKSGDLYPEQVLPQLAAYQKLLIEHGREIQDMGAHAMSINKKTGGFVHRYFTPEEVNRGWRAFDLMLQLHSLIKELK